MIIIIMRGWGDGIGEIGDCTRKRDQGDREGKGNEKRGKNGTKQEPGKSSASRKKKKGTKRSEILKLINTWKTLHKKNSGQGKKKGNFESTIPRRKLSYHARKAQSTQKDQEPSMGYSQEEQEEGWRAAAGGVEHKDETRAQLAPKGKEEKKNRRRQSQQGRSNLRQHSTSTPSAKYP